MLIPDYLTKTVPLYASFVEVFFFFALNENILRLIIHDCFLLSFFYFYVKILFVFIRLF